MGFEVVTLWEAYGPAIGQTLDDDVWIVEQAEAGRILLTRDRLRLARHRRGRSSIPGPGLPRRSWRPERRAADCLGEHEHPTDRSAVPKTRALHRRRP